MIADIGLILWCTVNLLFIIAVSKNVLKLHEVCNRPDRDLADIVKRLDDLDSLERAYLRIEGKLDSLDPEEVLAALAAKEHAFDRANTRIDNGIAAAHNLGQTAGEAAARNLVRQCIERAMAGKGPPMQILSHEHNTAILLKKAGRKT